MIDPRLSIIDERLSRIKEIIAVASGKGGVGKSIVCLLYTSPSPRDLSTSRMPSSA